MKRHFMLVLVLCLGLAGSASAALDTSNAYVDGDSVTWAGQTTMSSSDVDFSADIEWCVDAPGGDGLFKYKYQVTCTGTVSLSKFSVGMLASNEAQGIGYVQIDPTDIAPTNAAFAGTYPDLQNADWEFAGMEDGEISYELFYYSVNEPIMFGGSIQDGVTAGGLVPSPSDVIPEPATLSLLAIGAAAGLFRRRR